MDHNDIAIADVRKHRIKLRPLYILPTALVGESFVGE
jgi:hypothetical protein